MKGFPFAMSDPRKRLPRLARIATLCPLCGELCTWYRLSALLYGVCPDHGRVEEIEIPAPPEGFRCKR